VSKQDHHFANVFSAVIGILVTIAILLFVLARHIGTPFEAAQAMADKSLQSEVDQRIAPAGAVAVAGRDNSALAIVAAPSAAAAPAAATPKNGEEAFKAVCSTCHGEGIAGAPKFGDHAAWAPRLAEGKATLYQHALQGYQGKAGVMPAKGGRPDLSDDLIRQAVDYMTKAGQ
jgi:cytochrome c5